MACLATLQKAFVTAIQPQSTSANDVFRNRPPLSNTARLEIYRHNISGGQIRALESTFPVIAAILGERSFAKLARDYAWSIGSPAADLNTLGHQLPTFIQTTLGNLPAFAELPYLTDLAKLEWAWSQAHLAADDPVFDLQRFQSAAIDGRPLRFQASQAMTLLKSDFPILAIWKDHRNGRPARTSTSHPSQCIVWRAADHTVHADPLDAEEAILLTQILSGDDLSTIIEENPNIPIDGLLPNWVANGWLVMRGGDNA